MMGTIKTMRIALAMAVIAAVLSGCSAVSQEPPAAPTAEPAQAEAPAAAVKVGPFKGMQAPDFTLKDMEGTEWTLSELKGNSVALVFFTSW